MTESLKEIIRVLQLTSPTEEEGAFASSTGGDRSGLPGGILPGSFAAKVYEAKALLSQSGQWAFIRNLSTSDLCSHSDSNGEVPQIDCLQDSLILLIYFQKNVG